jgi:hypothetical protein
MLDRQRTIVQSTDPAVQEHGETIARVFYRHLREEHPELASMFNARDQSGWNQARGLAAAYASNIDGLHMLESITSIARTYYPASRRLSISKRISRATGDGTWIDQTRLTDRRRTANGNSEDR